MQSCRRIQCQHPQQLHQVRIGRCHLGGAAAVGLAAADVGRCLQRQRAWVQALRIAIEALADACQNGLQRGSAQIQLLRLGVQLPQEARQDAATLRLQLTAPAAGRVSYKFFKLAYFMKLMQARSRQERRNSYNCSTLLSCSSIVNHPLNRRPNIHPSLNASVLLGERALRACRMLQHDVHRVTQGQWQTGALP